MIYQEYRCVMTIKTKRLKTRTWTIPIPIPERMAGSKVMTGPRQVYPGNDHYWLYPTFPDFPADAVGQGWTFTRVP